MFVVVTGPPASGKSTLARALAAHLELPLIAKDPIKEALMDALGLPADVEQSHRLGRAAVSAMIATAQLNTAAVLDSVWLPYTVPLLRELTGPIIEVRCRLSRETAAGRYHARVAERHRGHLGHRRPPEELWNYDLLTPLGVGPVVPVDTESPVPVAQVASRIRRAARTHHAGGA